jgi:hypothetical protein
MVLSPLFNIANIAPPYSVFARQKRKVGNREFGGELHT